MRQSPLYKGPRLTDATRPYKGPLNVAEKKQSKGEETLASQLAERRISFEREQMLIPKRRFRFDFVLIDTNLIVEVEGGVYMARSRHTSGAGFEKDCEKYNLAILHGFRVLRFTTRQVMAGDAIGMIYEILVNEGVKRR